MTSTPKPRYQQLKEQIISRISSGDLRPQDRVPSEHELVGSAGVSRMTANRALRELTDEGYVERVAGVGAFFELAGRYRPPGFARSHPQDSNVVELRNFDR